MSEDTQKLEAWMKLHDNIIEDMVHDHLTRLNAILQEKALYNKPTCWQRLKRWFKR